MAGVGANEFPKPLPVEAQNDLRVELRQLERERDTAERDMVKLASRVKACTLQKANLCSQLEHHRRVLKQNAEAEKAAADAAAKAAAAEATVAPAADEVATASVDAPAAAAAADDSNVPLWKRNREKRLAAQGQASGSGAPPSAVGPGGARVARGAVFGALRGAIATAAKAQDGDSVVRQRLAQQSEVQLKTVLDGLRVVSADLEAYERDLEQVTAKYAPVKADTERLEAVVDRITESETAYADAHFLRAEGAHYDVPFVPAQHTEHSKAMLEDQILTAATLYIDGFRKDADHEVKAMATRRAARFNEEAQQQQQQQARGGRRNNRHRSPPRQQVPDESMQQPVRAQPSAVLLPA